MGAGIFQLFLLVAIFVGYGYAIYFAFEKNNELQKSDPSVRPYRWGYFQSALVLAHTVFGGAALLVLPVGKDFTSSIGSGLLQMALGIALVGFLFWLGFALFKRRRSGWIVFLILLALGAFSELADGQLGSGLGGLLVLALSGIYVQKRWEEFSRPAPQSTEPPSDTADTV